MLLVPFKDPVQMGVGRIDFHALKDKTVYPEVLKRIFDNEWNITTSLYLGATF